MPALCAYLEESVPCFAAVYAPRRRIDALFRAESGVDSKRRNKQYQILYQLTVWFVYDGFSLAYRQLAVKDSILPSGGRRDLCRSNWFL